MPTILASTISINPVNIDPKLPMDTNPIEQILNSDNTTDTVSDLEQKERELKAAKIDAYFKGKPLEGHGMGMVLAAEKYDLDWKILPAIAKRETTGGEFACNYTAKTTGDIRYTYNVFGWGSCKIKFESYEAGFETLAKNLSGNNPATARYYAKKNTVDILMSYNPPHIVKDYSKQVVAMMDAIENTPINTNKELSMR